jgi:hypothetical protein
MLIAGLILFRNSVQICAYSLTCYHDAETVRQLITHSRGTGHLPMSVHGYTDYGGCVVDEE